MRNLLLAVLAARNPAPPPRVLDPGEIAAVRAVLLGTMGTPDDAETARVYDTLDDPAGLRLLPLADYARVPLLVVSANRPKLCRISLTARFIAP